MLMLNIVNLIAKIDDKTILNGIHLKINDGEIHVIMGPNGSGKSSLASIIAGNPKYEILKGNIFFNEKDILEDLPEERANKGIFLAFQYPTEIPGINNNYFIKTALNSKKEYNNEEKVNSSDFLQILNIESDKLNINKELLKRQVNYSFSGGEKKKNEILQLAILKPKLAILDEIDSGLDIDALKDIGTNIKNLHTKDNSFLIITHHSKILEYIKPDFIHILINGKIKLSGGLDLLDKINNQGYINL